jgi:hypothetical protein
MSQSKNHGTATQRRPRTKAGRTILVKPSGSTFDASVFETLTGRQSTHHTEKSNSYFLTFATSKEALDALKTLKSKSGSSMRVKFAHYRIFFKMEGLVDSTDYNTVKNAHTKLISEKGGSEVLYYRLYRKDNKFLGCGDFTIDTKEAFDKMLNAEELKNFTLEGDIKGVHYRYKKANDDQHEATASS